MNRKVSQAHSGDAYPDAAIFTCLHLFDSGSCPTAYVGLARLMTHVTNVISSHTCFSKTIFGVCAR